MKGTIAEERRKDKSIVDEKKGNKSAPRLERGRILIPNNPSFLARRRFTTT